MDRAWASPIWMAAKVCMRYPERASRVYSQRLHLTVLRNSLHKIWLPLLDWYLIGNNFSFD